MMNVLHQLKWLCLALCFACPQLEAQESLDLRLAFGESSDNGEPPYYYLDKDGALKGVVVDILRMALSPARLTVTPVYGPRKRLMGLFRQDKVDIDVMNAAWIPADLPVLFSNKVYTFNDIIYARVEDLARIGSFEALKGHTVCTQTSYIYAKIQILLDAGSINRIDSETQEKMLKMLLGNRCDILVGSADSMGETIHTLGLGDRIQQTTLVDQSWDIQFMLNERHADKLQSLNEFIGRKDYPEIFSQLMHKHAIENRSAHQTSAYTDR